LIGCFVNTLPLRNDLSGDPSFRELCHRVRATTLEAHSRQDLPFQVLLEAVRAERSLSATSLFQLFFDLNNTRIVEGTNVQGVSMRPLVAELGASKLDLVVDLWNAHGGLGGALEYRTDLL